MKLLLKQEPIAKARARHARRGGNRVVTYDPQHDDKMGLKWALAAQMREKGYKKLQGEAISLGLRFYCLIPQSCSKKRANALEGCFKSSKPDLDNFIKFYSDVLNGICFEDDRQIAEIVAEKRYSSIPRIEITIETLEEDDVSF